MLKCWQLDSKLINCLKMLKAISFVALLCNSHELKEILSFFKQYILNYKGNPCWLSWLFSAILMNLNFTFVFTLLSIPFLSLSAITFSVVLSYFVYSFSFCICTLFHAILKNSIKSLFMQFSLNSRFLTFELLYAILMNSSKF